MTIRMFQSRYIHGMSMSAEVDHHYIPTMTKMLLAWIFRYDMGSNNCRRSSLGATSSASMNEFIMNRIFASSWTARLVCLCSEVGATASFSWCHLGIVHTDEQRGVASDDGKRNTTPLQCEGSVYSSVLTYFVRIANTYSTPAVFASRSLNIYPLRCLVERGE
ncbi:hypothetical protein E4T43_07134 [Aureobasidium subglaciale]|nr:hypothetical protein E4T43_07134 [Aureobasidium subglaciale]